MMIDKDSLIVTQLTQVVRLYCEVWGGDPIDFAKRFKRHANYPGFDATLALVEEDAVGFAYGYTSTPGQYYHELLREELTKSNQEWWLGDCFEFVELAVHPNYRRSFKGQELAVSLLEDVQNQTAILTTQMNNTPAIRLYQKLNWEIIAQNFTPGDTDEPYVIMGKKLIP